MACDDFPEVVELSRAEEAIVDILTIGSLQKYSLSMSSFYKPLLVDKDGKTLCECHKLSKVSDDLVHFDNDSNVTLRDNFEGERIKGLGTLYFVLTAISLQKRNIRLCSDYDSAATITTSSKGLWNKFVRLELAHKDPSMYRYFFDIPENFKALQMKAEAGANKLQSAGEINKMVSAIQTRLRLSTAGNVLASQE